MKHACSLIFGSLALSFALMSAPANAFDVSSLTPDQLAQLSTIATTLGVSPTTLLLAAADGITMDDIAILPPTVQTQVISYISSGATLPTDLSSLQNFADVISAANTLGVDAGSLSLALLNGFDATDISIFPPAIQSQLLAFLAAGGTLPTDLAGLLALIGSLPAPTDMYYSNTESKWITGAFAATDIDSDGLLDAMEAAAGTSPTDAASNIFGGSGQSLALTVKSFQIKLNFGKVGAFDSLSVNGFAPQSGTVNREGQKAIVYIGGVARSFTLDKTGKSQKAAAPDQFKISAPRNGTSKFTAKLSSAAFRDALVDEKLTNANVQTTSTVVVKIAVDMAVYTANVNVAYTGKQGKGGRAKISK